MKISDEMVERAARAMCERDGFRWDAASVMETANGDEPEQQREYWLDKADAALTAALAVQTQQGVEVKKLSWDDDDTAENGFWGAYEITDHGDGRYDVSMDGGRIASGRKLPSKHAAKAAAQSDYETRIRSALVDVPAVESEPVAWRYRFRAGKWTVQKNKPDWFKNGVPDCELEPLYAHPPRSLSNEGEIVAAAVAVLNSWDERLAPEQERKARLAGTDHEYWSPAASMVSSEAIANLRAALSTRKGSAGDGAATGTKGISQ